MRSRQLVMRIGAVASLLAAVVVAVAVPGIGKWIVAAVLAGLASAVSGLVARSADRSVARGRAVVLDPKPSTPIVVTGSQEADRAVDRGHIGPIPEDVDARRANVVALWRTSVYVAVEAVVNRAVILTGLSVQIESRSAPPDVQILPRRRPKGRPRRTFNVQLSDVNPGMRLNVGLDASTPRLEPAEGVPDFPYTVAPDDPEVFVLRAALDSAGDVQWRVGVHWVCNGESGVVIADDEGRPFRLVRPRQRPCSGEDA
ncbi:hypothetical protein AB0D59_50285 [Streptomyces sp. NPDC048417]|uniref:hypothetical protein n=1 Tax=Streptomyces sp. NPDC048417 TaxID=3155387 RepID=UPI00343BE1BF